MTITWATFAIRLLVGFFLAVGIGIERQWLKTRSVLKTNVLVTLGSAMFVMLSIMTPGDASPTRISAQIVSGVGFLGGGVILREGASVRGINTAATLWCAAAIGTLVGSGYFAQAYVSTLAVVGANLLLRPLVKAFQQQEDDEDERLSQGNSESSDNFIQPKVAKQQSSISSIASGSVTNLHRYYRYSCHVLCFPEFEDKVLEIIFKFAREQNLIISGVESNNIDNEIKPGSLVEIKADFTDNSQISWEYSQEIIKLLKTEARVKSVNWQLK